MLAASTCKCLSSESEQVEKRLNAMTDDDDNNAAVGRDGGFERSFGQTWRWLWITQC